MVILILTATLRRSKLFEIVLEAKQTIIVADLKIF